MTRIAAKALAGLVACAPFGAAMAGADAAGTPWVLVEQNDAPFAQRATLIFGADGQISGQAPCNRFFFTNSASLPRFETGPIAATRMACRELESEGAFFQALQEMQTGEIQGDVLILRNPTGGEMVFKASE